MSSFATYTAEALVDSKSKLVAALHQGEGLREFSGCSIAFAYWGTQVKI